MAVKVLVVDDSSFFRRRVSEILEQDSGIEVIGFAVNGREAVDKTAQLRPDMITMDVEMPVLDGISAVKEIMASNPTPILMFSSLTRDGATATLDALDAGAMDFLPKKFEDIARNNEDAIKLLQTKVKEIGRRRAPRPIRPLTSSKSAASPTSKLATTSSSVKQPDRSFQRAAPATATASMPSRASGKHYQIVAIGTSTGGPVALQTILTQLPANFAHPILLIQHMPAAFTPAFAARLNSLCKIRVKEAQQGDRLEAGTAYLAPGGQQMMVEGRSGNKTLRVFEDNSERISYKPSVDVTFASVAKSYQGDALAIVLTGMGADGRDGARMLKQAGATIWAQDEKSCVVYGMPQAIANAGLASEHLALSDVAARIKREIGCG
ncbi:chemotaxis response regulator protein-glutamate methylesterase [Pseudoalteromonas undina]|uniref:Chemotaxis response regulator protein-glutamate methylesterase n=1 Tax=Pseudoalteromonas undina TaxID=43660 RepID=A0ACC6R5I3_9GAMM